MKLHHIAIQNFLGARQIDLAVEQPITLLAGMNGAGKSSLKDAISLALTADLCRVAKKGEAAALISEGASAARVFVQTDERDFEVAISKAGKITDSAAGTEPPAALPFVLEPARFARLGDTERRTFLFGLLGIETSHKAIGERMEQTDAALEELRSRLERFPQFEVREVEAGGPGADDRTETRLFGAVENAFRDVPPSRVGGAVLITDGQVHDLPASLGDLPAPIHSLITGEPDEFDRRIRFERAPRFGIVGREMDMSYRVISTEDEDEAIGVRVLVNGETVSIESAMIGQETPLRLMLPNAGRNIVELAIEKPVIERGDQLALGQVPRGAENHVVERLDGNDASRQERSLRAWMRLWFSRNSGGPESRRRGAVRRAAGRHTRHSGPCARATASARIRPRWPAVPRRSA